MSRNNLRTLMPKTRFFQSVKKSFLSFWQRAKVPNPFTLIVLPYFLYILLSFAVYSLGVENGIQQSCSPQEQILNSKGN